MDWIWITFWILFFILATGVILFLVGLEAPHANKPDNTVNYETLKWVGIALLITGGVGMLIWAYFKFRNNPRTVKSIERFYLNPNTPNGDMYNESEILNQYNVKNKRCDNALDNLKQLKNTGGYYDEDLYNRTEEERDIWKRRGFGRKGQNWKICQKYGPELTSYSSYF